MRQSFFSFKHHITLISTLTCLAPLTGCEKPEIAEVLDDYCDFKVNQCRCSSPGTTKYWSDAKPYSACERFHKDLLNTTSDGKASSCKGDVSDFFIELMNSQMADGCDKSCFTSLLESEVADQMSKTLSCLEDNGIDTTQIVNDLTNAIVD